MSWSGLIRVTGQNFVCGAVIREGHIVRCAPLLRYLVKCNSRVRLLEVASMRRWKVEEMP